MVTVEDWGEEMSGREVKYTVQAFQSEKAYCAAFCASPVALIAGSGFTASCKGLQWSCNGWKQRRTVITYSKMCSVDLFILGQAWNVFGILLLREQVSPWLLRSTLAYIFSEFLRYKLCKECESVDKIFFGAGMGWLRVFLWTAGK